MTTGIQSQPAMPSREEARNFFGRLFDWSLRSFVTPSIISILFVISVVGYALSLLVFIVAAAQSSASAGILMLILSPLFFVLGVIFIRMYFELIIVLFRIEEHTRRASRSVLE